MEPANFLEANATMDTPEGVDPDVVRPLRVHKGAMSGYEVTTLCFKPTKAEMAEIQRTGRVWVQLMTHRMPAIRVFATYPFEMEATP